MTRKARQARRGLPAGERLLVHAQAPKRRVPEMWGLFDPPARQSANGGALLVPACKGLHTVIC